MKKSLLMVLLLLSPSVFAAEPQLNPSTSWGDSLLCVKRGRGHPGDKMAIKSGDIMNGLAGLGYNGLDFTTARAVAIEMQANQDWTSTANGTKMVFKTTPDGTASAITAMTLDDDGNLSVTGTITATGGAASFNSVIPSTQTIADTNTITADACGGIKRLTSAGAVTTDTTNTFTAPSASNAGCIMHLINVGSQNIVLDTNALFVSAGAANVTMTGNDALIVASDGSKWYQISALLAN